MARQLHQVAFDVERAAHRAFGRAIFLLASVAAMDAGGVRGELSGVRGHPIYGRLRNVPVLDAFVGQCSSQPHSVGSREQ